MHLSSRNAVHLSNSDRRSDKSELLSCTQKVKINREVNEHFRLLVTKFIMTGPPQDYRMSNAAVTQNPIPGNK